MRRNRIILYICWILTLVGISFYGGPISYGFLIAVTMIPVLSLFYILCVILQFKIYQRLENQNLISNRTSLFYFTLQNESLMTFAGIRVFFYSTFSTISGLEDSIEYELSPHSGIKKQTELLCRYRGEYEVGIKKIVVQDFFRLFSIAYKNREPLRVRVKPNIVTLHQLSSEQKSAPAAKEVRINRQEPDVLVREYIPYDDPRMIHWKASASMQKLMVRERIDEQQKGIALVLTPRRISNRIETYLPAENKMLEVLIALALYYTNKSIPVTAYIHTNMLLSYVMEEHRAFEAFYEQMCEYCFDTKQKESMLYDEIIKEGSIFVKQHVCLLVYDFDPTTLLFAQQITKSGLSLSVFMINDDPLDFTGERLPRCEVTRIPVEADLTEVM